MWKLWETGTRCIRVMFINAGIVCVNSIIVCAYEWLSNRWHDIHWNLHIHPIVTTWWCRSMRAMWRVVYHVVIILPCCSMYNVPLHILLNAQRHLCAWAHWAWTHDPKKPLALATTDQPINSFSISKISYYYYMLVYSKVNCNRLFSLFTK